MIQVEAADNCLRRAHGCSRCVFATERGRNPGDHWAKPAREIHSPPSPEWRIKAGFGDEFYLQDFFVRLLAARDQQANLRVAQEADPPFPVTVLEFVLGGRYAWGTTAGLGLGD